MDTLVPYTPQQPKSRLGAILSGQERTAFARVMLEDVLNAVREAGGDPTVLTTERLRDLAVPQVVDERPLSPAVNAALDPPMAVVMADLALATRASLGRTFDVSADLGIVPGRGGGTNVLIVRDAAFSVDYHGNSLADHRAIAAEQDLDCREIDSFRLSTDIDEPVDLAEVLLHGTGRAPTWLREHGVRLQTSDGRVCVVRSDE